MRRQSVPVAVDIERSLLRSSLFLQLEARWYDGVPLGKFTADKRDAAETACVAALEDIRTNNYAHFKNIWEIPPKPAESPNKPSSGVQVGDSNAWLDGYHSGFDFEHVTMAAEVLVGSHSVCVWDAKAKSGPVRRAFIVRGHNGGERVSAVTSDTKLEEIILNSLEAARRTPEKFKPVFDFHPRYQYPIPLEGKGNSGEHPVFLQFEGMPLDVDLVQQPKAVAGAAIEFYARAYQTYSKNDIESFTGMFTARSGDHLKQWLEEQKDNKASPPVHGLLDERYAKFEMNGDPVYLIFLSGRKGKWDPALSYYRYVIKDQASGKFEIANLGYQNALDQFLDSDLFDRRILMAPAQKPATPAPPKKAAQKNNTSN